ncbi:MAG: peptidoglycan-binding protein [Clostridia bacterium]|nr:peptidoglycan-binding protein [Clostridia bacterium]
MFCSNCGKTLRSDDNVCPHCRAAVGESRFEGQPYTGAQMKTKPGEAVRLPANHTKTTYMGVNSAAESEVDARTTYRATSDKVYSYDETEPDGEVYDEDFARKDENALSEAEIPADADETIYDAQDEDQYETDAYDDAAYADEEMSDLGDPEYEHAIAEDEGYEAFEDEIPFDDEEEEKTSRRERRNKKHAAKETADDEDQELIASLNDEELEELKETLNPTKKKGKKPQGKTRRKTEEELLDEEMFEEIRARDLNLDDEEASVDMSKYAQSGRYDKPAEEEAAAEKAKKNKPVKKKKGFMKKDVFSFLKKREEDFEIDEIEDEAFEEMDEENAFNLNDLPEMDETNAEETEYADEEISDEALEGIELNEEELEFDERRKKLSPKAIAIIKYACAAVIVVGVLVGVIMGLSYITEKTKKAPIEGVTYDLYLSGIELMQYRASDSYRNEILSAYDGMASSMIAITAGISSDLDAISKMMPSDPDVNDARFIDALKTIQTSINNSITNDMLSVSDASKTAEVKEAESAARWQSVRDMVTVLTGATSTAQLDAIIKGERVEVIQQTTPEPAATSTPVPYTTLAKGSEGSAVRKLQTRLADLGYLTSEIDGNYGNKTKTAVQLFQKTAGLEVTGIADADTQIALYADDAPKKP